MPLAAWEGPAGWPASARQACSDLPGHRQNPVSLSSQLQARRQPEALPSVWGCQSTALPEYTAKRKTQRERLGRGLGGPGLQGLWLIKTGTADGQGR